MSLVAMLRWGIRHSALIPLCIALAAFSAEVPAPASGLSVSVDVVRTDAAKGTFLCTAEITDLQTGEVISAPKIAFTSASSATTKSGIQSNGKKPASEVVMEVSASKAGDRAAYTVSYTREGVLVARQKGSLSLR